MDSNLSLNNVIPTANPSIVNSISGTASIPRGIYSSPSTSHKIVEVLTRVGLFALALSLFALAISVLLRGRRVTRSVNRFNSSFPRPGPTPLRQPSSNSRLNPLSTSESKPLSGPAGEVIKNAKLRMTASLVHDLEFQIHQVNGMKIFIDYRKDNSVIKYEALIQDLNNHPYFDLTFFTKRLAAIFESIQAQETGNIGDFKWHALIKVGETFYLKSQTVSEYSSYTTGSEGKEVIMLENMKGYCDVLLKQLDRTITPQLDENGNFILTKGVIK